MARPTIPIDADEVERLAGLGLTQTQICLAIGISEDTLRRRKKQSDQLRHAIERGRARSTASVSSALVEKALSGNVRAQIFFLRMRGGWQRALPAPTEAAMTREEALEELILAFD